MNNDLGLEWLRTCFEPTTSEKLMDKHVFFFTTNTIVTYPASLCNHDCIQHNIDLLIYVGVFRPLKTAEFSSLVSIGASRTQKAD